MVNNMVKHEVMDILINLIVSVLQWIDVSNYHIAHLKYIIFSQLYLNTIGGKKNTNTEG